MANRVFVAAVIVLWLGSMSWLMVDKILPSYYDGEAPLAAGFEPNVPVAWKVSWDGRQVGHAASIRLQGVSNTTNLVNRVVLEDVPLLDLVPALMRHVVGDVGRMKLDANTTLDFDSLDNFSGFHSRVSINDVSSVLELHGEVSGGFLELKVNFNGVTYSPQVAVPDQTMLNETLVPDAKLPYMWLGRRWEEEVYSPFRSPSSPVATVEAEVTGEERIEYDGELLRVMRIEYRATADPGVPEEARLQAITWVRPDDGLVLQQDVIIANSKLRFERLPEAEAADVGRTLLTPPPRQRHGGHRRSGMGAGPSGGRRGGLPRDSSGDPLERSYPPRHAARSPQPEAAPAP